MKHKKFNDILPYTYFIQNRETKEKYYGVRYKNIKLGLTPIKDFGVKYFTSSKYINFNKSNVQDWIIKLHYTFDTVDEALEYEMKLLTKIYKKDDWLNKTNNKAIYNDKKMSSLIGKKISLFRAKNYWNNGLKTHTEETRLKLSNSIKGTNGFPKGISFIEKLGEEKAREVKIKMANAKKGITSPRKGRTNKEMMGEEKAIQLSEQLSKLRKGRPNKNKGKKYSNKKYKINNIILNGTAEVYEYFKEIGIKGGQSIFSRFKKGISKETDVKIEEVKNVP